MINFSRFARLLTPIKNEILSNENRWLHLKAGISQDNQNLVVKHNKITEKFPLVWLRDNCPCENCFHESSQSRIIDWNNFDVNVEAKFVQIKDERDIEINWQDNHKSVYSLDWLKQRSFLKDNQESYLRNIYLPPKKTWNKNEFSDILKMYEYQDVMNNDEILYQCLVNLAVYGVALIKNVPQNEKECRKVTERIAFSKRTHYGEDFHIIAKEGTNNVAYLSTPLQLHTDLPYYAYKPGVILLHCIVQAESSGGGNLLTDALHVAEKFRLQKDAFDLLSQVEVNWSDVGEEDGVKFHKIHRAPVISLDQDGNITSIRHSIPQRDSHFTVDIDKVIPWYKALKMFVEELHRGAVLFKTRPGDILILDNTRLVHGRQSYKDQGEVKRFLVGNYIDWDEIYSKLRVLGNQFAK